MIEATNAKQLNLDDRVRLFRMTVYTEANDDPNVHIDEVKEMEDQCCQSSGSQASGA